MSRINAADIARFRASGGFDERWYLDTYPDVASSGIDPAEHYLWIGARLGRQPMPISSDIPPTAPLIAAPAYEQSSPSDNNRLDALFVDGTNGTSSTPYRVFRIAQGLTDEGWNTRCVKGEDLFSMMDEEISARFVIFHRAPYWSPFVEFADKMRARGAIIVYDIDDLVFDESVIPYIDGYRYLSEAEKEGFHKGVRAYRDFILNADMCTSTTGFLVDEMKKQGKPAFRIRNAISKENIEFFEKINYTRDGRPKPFVIGYYSGTKTHQADFAEAAPALIQFMNENPDVVFRLVGDFNIEDWPELSHWQHIYRAGDVPRVTRVSLMPHDAMIRDQFSCDLIIAPLPIGNPFCEAKSELKFFEASLAKCPVIVSAMQCYVEATQNGQLGLLARHHNEWLESFREVYENYPRALERARAAYDFVRTHYAQRFAANEALTAYSEFEALKRNGVPRFNPDRVAEVGIVLPDFTGPAGGHRKIFSICRELEQSGKKVRLYFYGTRSADEIRSDLTRFYFKLDAEIQTFNGQFQPHAFLVCTQWRTAFDCRNIKFPGKTLYFVQDFEPMFYPMGSEYLRAIASYLLGFNIICYGEWVAARLRYELDVPSQSIPFTLDHSSYHAPVYEGERDIDVLLYARPTQHRRCIELIVDGLAELKRVRPDIRIGLFGEDDYRDYGFEYTNFGLFSDLSELAALYSRVKIGICYSPTNPSQLGYEMVACGANLIDVRVKFAELNFEGENFVQYCDGVPESMSTACLALLDNPAERALRQARGYAFVARMPPDEALGAAFMRAAGMT